jgi:small-conductance mechanosensitive channel
MSGLMVIFSRALRPGEFIKVGETEGTVTEIGFLATKIRTVQQQEISLPNTVVASTNVINYSRLAGSDEQVATTVVSIGYDTPWRQVHALLEMAAARTAKLRKDASPQVLQRALSDFYVEYLLVVRIDRTAERGVALSELHANIQDAFNEYGVQIMSPNFVAQPEQQVVVPKEAWFTPPAGSPHTA